MSEPVKSVEIEDVLSSIRRLVSDDHRKVAAQPDEAAPPAPEKLVLTAALRVPEEPEASSDPEPVVQEDATAPLVLEPSQTAPVDAADNGEAEIPVDTGERDAEPEAPVEPMEPPADPSHLADVALAEAEPTVAPEIEDSTADAPWRDPEATLYGAAEFATVRTAGVTAEGEEDIRPLGEKIAALEEVIARTDDQWEPDGTGVDDYAGTKVDALEWEETEDEVAPEDITLQAEPAIEFNLDAVEEDELEHDELEHDEPEEDDAEADIAMEAALDEATLDEDALRALVADIVREELQGVLGERITRNVRKLVRREIQRALALKDLD